MNVHQCFYILTWYRISIINRLQASSSHSHSNIIQHAHKHTHIHIYVYTQHTYEDHLDLKLESSESLLKLVSHTAFIN